MDEKKSNDKDEIAEVSEKVENQSPVPGCIFLALLFVILCVIVKACWPSGDKDAIQSHPIESNSISKHIILSKIEDKDSEFLLVTDWCLDVSGDEQLFIRKGKNNLVQLYTNDSGEGNKMSMNYVNRNNNTVCFVKMVLGHPEFIKICITYLGENFVEVMIQNNYIEPYNCIGTIEFY